MGRHRQCDGISRRDVLRAGMLGSTGLTMGHFLRLTASGQVLASATAKSAILIELPGGPSHIDSFDPKPLAQAEVRGKFQPIKTNVSGIEICEHLPRLATVEDKFVILRGVSHSFGAHPLGQQYIFTGNRPIPSLEYPGFGSVVAKELTAPIDLPSYVAVPNASQHGGFLGVQYAPLSTNATPRPRRPFHVRGFSLAGSVTLEEIEKRRGLLRDLDRQFASIQKNDKLLKGLDEFSHKAFDMITSPRAREAFDISREPASIQKFFGEDSFSQSCLLAGRLIESGVRFVTVSMGGWDTHSDNFRKLSGELLPRLDSGLSGLLMALEQKGLLESTVIFVTGEFGRTPKINSKSPDGGRDHYPQCMFMLLAGGGVRGGQVLGESDAQGGAPKHEGFRPEDVAASFYHALGIDHRREYKTSTGRPLSIVKNGAIIPELFGESAIKTL